MCLRSQFLPTWLQRQAHSLQADILSGCASSNDSYFQTYLSSYRESRHIGLRLGLELCVPHQCHCGTQVDAFGRHAFVGKKAPSRSVRDHALNELVARAFSSAAIPTQRNRRACVGLTANALTVSLSSSVVEWKSSCLGCHSRLSFGELLCSLGCQRSKISSRVGSNQEG